MKIETIIDLTKKVVAQTLGTTYMTQEGKLAAIESGKLVDVGKDVLDMQNGVDSFTKACIDVIGKYDFDSFTYEPEIKSIMRDNWEWGAFLERIKNEPQQILTDDIFNLVDGTSYADIEHKFYKPNVKVKIFAERKGFSIPISFTEDRVKTAFTSMGEMAKFFASIREYINQQKKMILDQYAHVLVGSAIAISSKATNTSRHLLTEGKALGLLGAEDTIDVALSNEKFVAWVLKEIATTREYMRRPSSGFNNKSGAFASGQTSLFMLNAFEKATRFGVIANTYHNDELAIGDYDVVSAWQGIESTDGTKKFDFATVSSVMITDAENKLGLGTEPVTINNCIACLCDYKAIGINCEYQKVTSSYTASADFWTDFHHNTINYLLDSDYGIVAFLLD